MIQNVEKPRFAFNLVLALLIVSQLGETIYLPALPAITQSLSCSASWVQSLLGCFLLAYGAVQFLYGPLSDYFGRRKIILCSVGLFLIGTFFAATAKDIAQLLIGCLVMGVGIGSGGLMCRTVLRDLYSGIPLQKASSIVGITLVFTPLLAPLVGAYCLIEWDWRAIFWFMGIAGLLLWGVLWLFLEETNLYRHQTSLELIPILQGYRTVIVHPAFIGNAVCVSANCAALMAYEAVMPFLLQNNLGYSPLEYAGLIVLPVSGFLLGSLWNVRLARNRAGSSITRLGINITWVGSFLLLLPGLGGHLSVGALLVPAFLFMLGSGLLFATTTASALSPFARMAGIAGASLGGLQNISAGLGTLSVSWLPVHNQVPMALTMLGLVALCHWVTRKNALT